MAGGPIIDDDPVVMVMANVIVAHVNEKLKEEYGDDIFDDATQDENKGGAELSDMARRADDRSHHRHGRWHDHGFRDVQRRKLVKEKQDGKDKTYRTHIPFRHGGRDEGNPPHG
jgi:hypothetical protein